MTEEEYKQIDKWIDELKVPMYNFPVCPTLVLTQASCEKLKKKIKTLIKK